jgi:hypothetical protein
LKSDWDDGWLVGKRKFRRVRGILERGERMKLKLIGIMTKRRKPQRTDLAGGGLGTSIK